MLLEHGAKIDKNILELFQDLLAVFDDIPPTSPSPTRGPL